MMGSIINLTSNKINPLKSILNTLEFNESTGLQGKVEVIQKLINTLEDIEADLYNKTDYNTWARIASVFGSALCLSGFAVINPVLAVLACIGSSTATLGLIGTTLVEGDQIKSLLPTLKKYRIALKSVAPVQWATLWDFAGTDLFFEALGECQGYYVADGRILHKVGDGRTPITASIDFVSHRYNVTRDALLVELKKIKDNSGTKLPTQLIHSTTFPGPSVHQTPAIHSTTSSGPSVHQTPTTLQLPPSDNLHQVALNILDGLVVDADQSKLGGCIILAAPGAGKTTYLGTAWGRLKAKYGEKFKSLAVVVKQSDLEAFKACSDRALCVKNSPIDVAIAIIQFINDSMTHDGMVKRLFLDDFLSMISKLEIASKGMYINPSSGRVYQDKKECKDAEEYNAVPLFECLIDALKEAWTVGREYNLSLYVSSHSSNVQDLPFVASRQARSVGSLIYLAKNDKREFIDQVLNDPNLIADNLKRQQLKEILNNHQSSNDEPWVLSNSSNWSLGIVSSEIRQEYEGYREQWNAKSLVRDRSSKTESTVENLEKLFQLECDQLDVHISEQITPSGEFASPGAECSDESKVYEIIKAANSYPIAFESIRKSKRWEGKSILKNDLIALLNKLISKGKIEGDIKLGYTPLD